jgi:hypothetical protein
MKARGPIREAAELGLLYFAGALVGRVLRDRANRRKAQRLAEYLNSLFTSQAGRPFCPWPDSSCTCVNSYRVDGVTPGDSSVPPTRRFD